MAHVSIGRLAAVPLIFGPRPTRLGWACGLGAPDHRRWTDL